ncbi:MULTISPECIES: DUF58 domain-containing protein [unclassified Cryobacterium]|uniref:DUF58 domain-containing protein n=1 Tax=unclassified Cryobacterium TaxID=2649013 RepID=UPI002AB5CDCA|nr:MULTISPECIES: DUF58 domain-containing protein [unclassified Cryobacterium]MDY7544297.1 DUF58 domain-containing protein [Cryobacterium sp. 5B3]MEA9999330.1 DUF58 domain-containing protein [Cryobacterium sp. RTS3]MEB0264663.1 DUF58 domain-containing protein [Cryobacterium sp. 10I5]MEB0275582.1 DUF58 domain-containing protein [Cryobacterium sp. 5B3]
MLVSLSENRRDLLFIALLLISVPLVAGLAVAIRPVRVRVGRDFRPNLVSAGGETTELLILENLGAQRLSGALWRETGPMGMTPMPRDLPLPTLAGLGGAWGRRGVGDAFGEGPDAAARTVRLECPLSPHARGRYEYGPVVLGQSDPFGLVTARWAVGGRRELVVTPRITPLPGRGLASMLGGGEALERQRLLNQNSDELIAREYRPGDSLRRVNWPATARHGEIMVRQEEHRSDSGVRFVLDTLEHAETGTREADRGRRANAFELGVEIAASVCTHLLAAGYRVDVVELGPAQLGTAQLGRAPHGAPGTIGAAPIGAAGFGGSPPAGSGDADPVRSGNPVSYRGSSGISHLLEDLAGIVQLPAESRRDGDGQHVGNRATPRARVPRGALPTFAVLGAGGALDLAVLAGLAASARPAIAFVLELVPTDALERLREAGWRCIPVRSATALPAAWLDAVGGRGALHEPA